MPRAMPSAKLVIGGAAATTALGIRVARPSTPAGGLLPEADRRRIEPLAEELKEQALRPARRARPRPRRGRPVRGQRDASRPRWWRPPRPTPSSATIEVHELREDLRRELERLASADIKAWRSSARGRSRHPGSIAASSGKPAPVNSPTPPSLRGRRHAPPPRPSSSARPRSATPARRSRRSTRSRSRSPRARSACSSARPAAARPRRCGWSTA